MKTRIILIIILLLILAALVTRNDKRINNVLLDIINPVKQSYSNFTQGIENKSHAYLAQKETIKKLGDENRILRKRLLDHVHYTQQIENIYKVLPDLSKLPISSTSIVETISYVKLNSFSQIILTKPKELSKEKLYGLIQKNVVAGVARLQNNQLYGFLTSDNKCRFSVFIGELSAPGIAIGKKTNTMIVKFIPKWHKIKEGDRVITSGLDDIFFSNIPVGIVTKIELQSSYKVAYIKTYSDVYHPKTFFLVHDPRATITDGFDSKKTNLKPFRILKTVNQEINVSNLFRDRNHTIPTISSIPSRIDQTQETIIEPIVPTEIVNIPKAKPKPKPKKIQKKRRVKKIPKKQQERKNKPKANSLDLF